MLGKHSDPDGGDHAHLDHVGRDSSYGFLALHREELFSDEDFAELYCPGNGRPSVPPSLTALLLQTYEGVSDEEAKARADFDLRWKVALGVGLEERPFAKSTRQLFRARLILHERMQTVFRKSLDFARYAGFFRSRRMKVVLDSSYILGRGALKDTYNLLWPTGSSCCQAHWPPEPAPTRRSGREHSLGRYFGSSVKGEAGIDWDDPEARRVFLDTRRGGAQFPKEDFRIDLEEMSCVCPAGQKTTKVVSISSGNRYGAPGVVRGWDGIAKTTEHAASLRRDGRAAGFEIVAKNVTPELAYVVQLEHMESKVGVREDVTPYSLRATMIFRPEDGTWKVVHRHADPITTPQPAESVIRE